MAMLDLVRKKIIWVDLALTSRGWINSVRKNSDNISKLTKVMINLNRPNIYDLLMMHFQARGVTSLAEKENIFNIHTAYKDISEYVS